MLFKQRESVTSSDLKIISDYRIMKSSGMSVLMEMGACRIHIDSCTGYGVTTYLTCLVLTIIVMGGCWLS